ncbi:hypothetical protein Tco_0084457 [Tanacetum coccineum]
MLDGGSDVPKGVEKVSALEANGVMSSSRVRVVWMKVGGGAEILMNSIHGIFFRGFWVEELALEAME